MDKTNPFGSNLSKIRKKKRLSQQELAEKVNELAETQYTRTTVSNWESGTSTPKLDIIMAIVKSLDVSPNELLGYSSEEENNRIYNDPATGSGGFYLHDPESGDFVREGAAEGPAKEGDKNVYPNVYPNVYLSQKDKTKGTQKEVVIRPVTVTVDHMLNEVITFVPVRAQAGYLIGYGDPEYVKELPAFAFPGFSNGTYRAFEVEGYSMLQYEGAGLYPKDIVIAEYVENPTKEIRDNRVYVVASNEGLLIKRCLNRLDREDGKLICNSDNKNGDYPPHVLDPFQIKEVWEFKGKFSRQIPKATRVYEEIGDLQAKYTLIEDQLKKMNEQLTIKGLLGDGGKEK